MIETAQKYPAIILAGGLSRRMGGGDKCLLEVNGQSLLRRVVARLAPQVGPIALNVNGEAERFAGYGLPIVSDSIPDYAGPLAGVLAGMDWAAELGADHLVSVAADTPFFPQDLSERFRNASDRAPVLLAASPDPDRGKVRHPTFGLWSVALRDDLRAALNDGLRKVVLWTDRHGGEDVMFDHGTGPNPFFNVNTPEDLAVAGELASREI